MNENKRMRFHLNSPSFRNFVQIHPELCTAWNATRTSGFGNVKKTKYSLQMEQRVSEQWHKNIYCLGFIVPSFSKLISWCLMFLFHVVMWIDIYIFVLILIPIYYSFNSNHLIYISNMHAACKYHHLGACQWSAAHLSPENIFHVAPKEAHEPLLCLVMRWSIFIYISLNRKRDLNRRKEPPLFHLGSR